MPLYKQLCFQFSCLKRGAAMGTTGIVIGLAPALGPTLSGWIIDSYTWRDLFGMVIPIVVLVLILASFLMKMSFNYLIQVSMSYRSFFLLSALVAYFTVSQALVIKVGVARKSMDSNCWCDCFMSFTYRQLHLEQPFLELRVLNQKSLLLRPFYLA